MKHFAAVIFFFFLGFIALEGQSFQGYTDLLLEHEEESAVVTKNQQHLFLSYTDDGFKIYSKNTFQFLMLNDKISSYTSHSIPFDSFTKIKNLKANTKIFAENKKKSQTIEVENFEVNEALRSGIFFDDQKEINFNFPALQKGAYATYEYDEHLSDPHLLSKFYFTSYKPVKESIFSATFDNHISVDYQLFNAENITVEFEEEKGEKTTTYTWTAKNLDEFKMEGAAPSFSYYEPHIILTINEVNLPDTTIKVLGSLDALYNWYYSLVKDVNKEPNKEIKDIVEDLTKDLETDKEKAKAIFYWVQDNVKYIAFEYGYGGFIPREASKICSNRYGDCKDMSSLLNEMYKEAGLISHLTWIGSRKLPYTYKENPTPFTDNHMIAAVEIDGETILTDATGQIIPFGLPTPMIQGKEALVAKGEGDYSVIKVEPVDKEQNLIIDSIDIVITDKKLIGSALKNYNGLSKYTFLSRFMFADPSDREDIIRGRLMSGDNRFILANHKLSGDKDRDKPLAIAYDFSINNYVKSIDDEFFLNLNLGADYNYLTIDIDERELPIEYRIKTKMVDIVSLEIPSGYEVSYVPENAKQENENIGFEVKYVVNENEITMKRTFYINTLLLENKDFESWNAVSESLNEAITETLVLKKK